MLFSEVQKNKRRGGGRHLNIRKIRIIYGKTTFLLKTIVFDFIQAMFKKATYFSQTLLTKFGNS